MRPKDAARWIKIAFEDGYNSYTTPANPMTTLEEEWNNSTAKQIHDQLLAEAQGGLTVKT